MSGRGGADSHKGSHRRVITTPPGYCSLALNPFSPYPLPYPFFWTLFISFVSFFHLLVLPSYPSPPFLPFEFWQTSSPSQPPPSFLLAPSIHSHPSPPHLLPTPLHPSNPLYPPNPLHHPPPPSLPPTPPSAPPAAGGVDEVLLVTLKTGCVAVPTCRRRAKRDKTPTGLHRRRKCAIPVDRGKGQRLPVCRILQERRGYPQLPAVGEATGHKTRRTADSDVASEQTNRPYDRPTAGQTEALGSRDTRLRPPCLRLGSGNNVPGAESLQGEEMNSSSLQGEEMNSSSLQGEEMKPSSLQDRHGCVAIRGETTKSATIFLTALCPTPSNRRYAKGERSRNPIPPAIKTQAPPPPPRDRRERRCNTPARPLYIHATKPHLSAPDATLCSNTSDEI
ncbi:hypothetical protein C7M84_019160 [Penaeus vannamei]|uniref:Uncharacterized protein n=1 Tax=Penaeus vannamei TaxID=6689 RepID=A0A423SFH9_PENVA|nr:hypothetical protein C7M84_019160 [Penaeus vannamei]